MLPDLPKLVFKGGAKITAFFRSAKIFSLFTVKIYFSILEVIVV